jgi:hypothetical protein
MLLLTIVSPGGYGRRQEAPAANVASKQVRQSRPKQWSRMRVTIADE